MGSSDIVDYMENSETTIPAKIQESEVVRVRLSGAKYSLLCAQAKQERRKITNLVQVMVEEGLEKRIEELIPASEELIAAVRKEL